MKALISYKNDKGEIKVDGPFSSIKDSTKWIAMLHQKGCTEISMTRIDVVCDFCSTPQVSCVFQIEAGVEIDAGHVDKDGKWGACAECMKLIVNDDIGGLAKRSLEQGLKRVPEFSEIPLDVAANLIATAHSHFWFLYMMAGKPKPEPVISDAEVLGGE